MTLDREVFMSLLQQDPTTEMDDAAKGEELTRGTSHVVWAAVAATVVVSIAIAIYIIAGQKPPVSKGEVLAVWAHSQQSVTGGLDASGAPIPQQTVQQVMVFARVRLKNQSDHPIILNNVLTNVTLADGIHSSYAANKGDYDRLFVAYPDITVPHGPAISPLNTEIDPGQTVEGEIVSAFRDMTKEQWDARTKLDFTFSFQYQPNMAVSPQVAVIDQ
jgi:hypothetical protein